MKRLGFVLVSVLLIAGCAVGQKISYEQTVPLDVRGSGSLDIAVVDMRPYVVDGDKSADFVGLQRGGYGNPFDVKTDTGNPLAEDIAESLKASLERSGFDVTILRTSPSRSVDSVRDRLFASASDADILLQLAELKSDTMNNAAYLYDVKLTVYRNRNEVAASVAQGRDDLGGSFLNPVGHAREAVPMAWNRLMRSLLDDPEVVTALER